MASASSDSTADTLQHIRRVELAQGITATVAPNISRDFHPSRLDQETIAEITRHEGRHGAIRAFSNRCHLLSDYAYWFVLGTLWVSYTDFSNINLWRRLFQSKRPNRGTSLMKPSELTAFHALPDEFIAYRAHRPGETDWLSYTLDKLTAARFARERGIHSVHAYLIQRCDVLSLFLRRGEQEILCLDPGAKVFAFEIRIVVTELQP